MKDIIELVRDAFGFGANLTAETVRKYSKFLIAATVAFGLTAGFLFVVFLIGVLLEERSVIAISLAVGGLASMAWCILAFPVVLAGRAGYEIGLVKKTFDAIGLITLWIFFLALYFFFVPVPAAAVPIVLVLCAAMAIASILFGVGISARFLSMRLGLFFTVLTWIFALSFLFPSSTSSMGNFISRVDRSLAGTMEEVAQESQRLPSRVAYNDSLNFFDPVSGEPLVWYYQGSDGGYELFDSPGKHPRYQEEFKPVTVEVVRELERIVQAAEDAEIANEKTKAEEQRLAILEQTVKEAKEKAAEVATIARTPGPPGPVGPAGPPGPVGEAKVIVEPIPMPVAPPQSPDPPFAPEPVYEWVTLPAGAQVTVLLNTRLSTETNQIGDTFPVESFDQVVVDGNVVLPERTLATGRIVALERPGRVSGVGSLSLVLESVSLDYGPNPGKPIQVETEAVTFNADSSAGKDATKVGIGAGIGAALGALFGGRDGAAAGAAIGGGATATQVMTTRGNDIVLPPEMVLEFRTLNEVALFQITR